MFNKTKKRFKKVFNEILETNNQDISLSESALPAYAHRNPFIDFLFWQRIRLCFDFIQKFVKIYNVKILDFGCGTGILSYLLAHYGYKVIAADIDLKTLCLIKEKIPFPDNIEFFEGDILNKNLDYYSFDIIAALDCLEHIENFKQYLLYFKKLLKPGGIIIVSGPTENWLYKFCRKIAGPTFTGEYHVNNIYKIKAVILSYFKILAVKRLFFPFLFFEIYIAENK